MPIRAGRESRAKRGAGKRLALCLPFLALVSFAGCAGDATAPETRDEIAVFGSLYVGERVTSSNAVLVTRVRPIDEPYDLGAAAVENAIVTLWRDGIPSPDTLASVGGGRYENSSVAIDPLTTYRLRVEVPGDRVLTAVTTTPHAFEWEGGAPRAPVPVRHGAIQDSFPIFVRCEDPEQIFLVDVYCRENWEDARYVNPFGGVEGPQDYGEYGGDNGEPRHIFAYFRLEQVVEEAPGYRIDFYNAMMAFFGDYDVQVLSIDENTYNWLYRDHPEENGGIVGGIGLFGSAQRAHWLLNVIE
jgi:hypothetical protein